MNITSLEEFDRDNAAKRAQLAKQLELAHAMPTKGVIVTWIGENGWESDGNTRKPDVERSIDLAPWIVHSRFRDANHVAYKAPDSIAGERGEHVSSQHRAEFVRKYFKVLLDTCEPHMIDTVAIRGQYASYVPESWDYASTRDYKDAHEVSRGLYEVQVSVGSGYTSAELAFYICTEQTGPCKISFKLCDGGYGGAAFRAYKLYPIGERRGQADNALITRWRVPEKTGACNVFRRGGADTRYIDGSCVPQSYTCEYLFDTREAMEAAIGLES